MRPFRPLSDRRDLIGHLVSQATARAGAGRGLAEVTESPAAAAWTGHRCCPMSNRSLACRFFIARDDSHASLTALGFFRIWTLGWMRAMRANLASTSESRRSRQQRILCGLTACPPRLLHTLPCTNFARCSRPFVPARRFQPQLRNCLNFRHVLLSNTQIEYKLRCRHDARPRPTNHQPKLTIPPPKIIPLN